MLRGLLALSVFISCVGAAKKASKSIMVGEIHNAPAANTVKTPSYYGPGDCVGIWKSAEGHCVMQTKCQTQDISHYVFSMLCIDQGGMATRNVFGEGSFAAQETFDTLLVCRRCAPDAPTGYTAPTAAPQQPVVPETTVAPTTPPPAGTITVMGQGAKAETGEMKKGMATQAQLQAVQEEVNELKVDLQSMNKAVTQLGEKLLAPAVAPVATVATASVAVKRKRRAHHHQHHAVRARKVQKRLRKRRVAAPRINEDGDIADDDDESDAQNEDADGDAADDDFDDNTVNFRDELEDEEQDDGRAGQDDGEFDDR